MSGSVSFPQGEEVFVGGEGTDASGVGIGALGSFRLQSSRTRHAQMRQGSHPAVTDDAAVVNDLPELGGIALSRCQICLPRNMRRKKAGNAVEQSNDDRAVHVNNNEEAGGRLDLSKLRRPSARLERLLPAGNERCAQACRNFMTRLAWFPQGLGVESESLGRG